MRKRMGEMKRRVLVLRGNSFQEEYKGNYIKYNVGSQPQFPFPLLSMGPFSQLKAGSENDKEPVWNLDIGHYLEIGA
jgi:hypothetical protein